MFYIIPKYKNCIVLDTNITIELIYDNKIKYLTQKIDLKSEPTRQKILYNIFNEKTYYNTLTNPFLINNYFSVFKIKLY